MSSSSMCQAVYDTVHTVVYDTVHTVSFDTLRTFDTVKVQLDSVFTIDLLNKSQEFYSNSFNWLLGVFGTFITIAVAVWGIRLYLENKKIKKIAKKASERAAQKVKAEFDERFEKQEKFVNGLKTTTSDLRESVIVGLFAQARLASYDNRMRLSLFCLALSEVSLHFEKSFIKHIVAAVVFISEIWAATSKQFDVSVVLRGIVTHLNSLEVLLNKVEYSSNELAAKSEMKDVAEALDLVRKLRNELTDFLTSEKK